MAHPHPELHPAANGPRHGSIRRRALPARAAVLVARTAIPPQHGVHLGHRGTGPRPAAAALPRRTAVPVCRPVAHHPAPHRTGSSLRTGADGAQLHTHHRHLRVAPSHRGQLQRVLVRPLCTVTRTTGRAHRLPRPRLQPPRAHRSRNGTDGRHTHPPRRLPLPHTRRDRAARLARPLPTAQRLSALCEPAPGHHSPGHGARTAPAAHVLRTHDGRIHARPARPALRLPRRRTEERGGQRAHTAAGRTHRARRLPAEPHGTATAGPRHRHRQRAIPPILRQAEPTLPARHLAKHVLPVLGDWRGPRPRSRIRLLLPTATPIIIYSPGPHRHGPRHVPPIHTPVVHAP